MWAKLTKKIDKIKEEIVLKFYYKKEEYDSG